jgi:hypothetical protein
MTKLIATAAIAFAGAAVLVAQTGTSARSQAPALKPAAVKAAQAGSVSSSQTQAAPQRSAIATGDAKTYRTFVNQYGVGCHNSRSAQPESDPAKKPTGTQ